jgi:hypothetical protein
LRSRISGAAAALALWAACAATAAASAPSVAALDAAARASGNRRDVAQQIGESLFVTQWPAEVNQVSANQLDDHLIVGIRMWGVKFHQVLTREQFVGEIVALAQRVFAAAPNAEEIDFWTSVPLEVDKGEVVSGDLARPTSRTVFTISVRRGETTQALRERALASGDGAFWDERWVRQAFAPSTLRPPT